MMNHHMSAAGQPHHIPPNMSSHPQSRRQQEYHNYHHQMQPQPHIHPGYMYPPHPQFYSPAPGPPPYPPPRWQQQMYQAPQPYMHHPPPPQPPPPQQVPYQQRSPMVVSSQPYTQAITPVTRQTPIPAPHPQSQVVPSPRPIPPYVQAHVHTPVAPPSPALTPKQEEDQEHLTIEREPTPPQPAPPPPARRQSESVNPLSLPPVHRMPFYPPVWLSPNARASPFPPRASRRRRRRQSLRIVDAVALPKKPDVEEGIQEQVDCESRSESAATVAPVVDSETQEQMADEQQSESSTIAAPSEPETPATSQAPSEGELTQVSTPATPAAPALSSPKATPTQTQHARRDTRTAIAVPNIPSFNRPKPSPPAAASPATTEHPASIPEDTKPASEDGEKAAEEAHQVEPPPPKPVPKSWADLVRRNTNTASTAALPNGGTVTNGIVLPKSASLADALKQYSVQNEAKLSFLEPRGLVNTGNMCYMNSILQVLIFCVPFYDFLDQVRQRTVHSMKSETPLVDAMIMFMREFKVLASADSSDGLRALLTPQQLEQYGEPVTPEYVYDAIRKLERFQSMRRGHQQDAEEFLGFLLEGLHDECVSVIQGQTDEATQESAITSPTVVASSSASDGWHEVGPKQKASVTRTAGEQDAPSPITKIFGGHLRQELRVPGLTNSVVLEPYKPLQLDIGAQHVNNIIDALRGITRTEALTGDFGGRSNSARKQVFIDTVPPVLILHLKRFEYNNNLTGTQKIWKKVGYPLELELPKDVFPPTRRAGIMRDGLPKYRLTSVVYHHGKSAAGGHYTVDVLREDGREWVRIDDTVIRRIRAEDVAEGGSEEDPKLLAKALEQHKADQELSKQRNMYDGLDDGEKEPEEDKPWSEVNGHALGHRKWNSVANTNGTATPTSTTGKRTPTSKAKEAVRDNKVAYILLYERMHT